MIEPEVKQENFLSLEEEPIPEEYKEPRIKNQNNISQNSKGISKPNIVISSDPQTNNISFINKPKNNEIKIINSNQDKIILENKNIINIKNNSEQNIVNILDNNKNFTFFKERPTFNNNSNFNHNINTNNNSISLSRVSKAKTTIPNYNSSKFDNYNIQQMRYNKSKEYSNIPIDMNTDFLNRMQNDIYKRQKKEDIVNRLIEENKIKIDEDERIKTFNRLIIDANRRLEAQENLENMKNKLEEDITLGPQKKYSDEEWKEIYNIRFKNYVDNINKKKEENIKLNIMKKIKDENEEINLCPTKKASQKHIEEVAQRMYDEAKKRKIKRDEKISRLNNFNYEDDDANKYVKKIKSESYSFIDDDEDDLNNMNSLEPGLSYNDYYIGSKNFNNKKIVPMKKSKNMAVSEFNNKRFDKKTRTGKSCSNFNNKNYLNKERFIQKKSNDFLNNNNNIRYEKNTFFSKNDYNLEEERKNLIQMASMKNLKKNHENNNLLKYNKQSSTSGVSNIVDQFFLRQMNSGGD